MTSINILSIGFTRPGLENVMSGFEHANSRFSDLPEQEADALLIRPPQLLYIYTGTSAATIYFQIQTQALYVQIYM